MPNRKIQVSLDAKLLRELDTLSKKQHQSRAEVIREACAQYVTKVEETELDRQYIESDKRMPETQEDIEWAEFGAEMMAQFHTEEKW